MKKKIAFFKDHPGLFFNIWMKLYNQSDNCEEAFEQFLKNDTKFFEKHPDFMKEVQVIKLNMTF